VFYPTRRQTATAHAYYSEWAELPLLFLLILFGAAKSSARWQIMG